MMNENKKYYIWGTGYMAQEINYQYKEQLEQLNVAGYIDNDFQKVGQVFCGKEIYGPNILLRERNCYIIIANTYRKEIEVQIEKKYPWIKDKIMEPLFFQRIHLISRYKSNKDKEIREIVDYLKDYPLDIFNYPFMEKYRKIGITVKYDIEKELYFIYHYGKKMYFSRHYKTKDDVEEYYKSICGEQDFKSPHRYLTNTFSIPRGSVVIDAGVAEGNFALSIIDGIKRIYLFEPDEEWMEALKCTFEPYKDKVVFINKSISNFTSKKITTIDSEIKEKIDFIKMDIEGEEYYALEGAEKTIGRSENMCCVICTYHQEFAYDRINHFLLEHEFNTEASKGYMWYPSETFGNRAPVLRRGVIRAQKKE